MWRAAQCDAASTPCPVFPSLATAESDVAGRPRPVHRGGIVRRLSVGLRDRFLYFGCGVISIIAAVPLKDHTNKDIDEYDIRPF
jgi:hypothetical protein